MQAYDLIMLIVLAMATIFGAIKGFAWQVASIASVIVSYIVAYRFRFEVAEYIQATPPWNLFLAMLILYVGTSFVIWVGFRLLSGAIDRVRLKEFDRHLGAGFGFVKGLIYCLLITMFAMSLLGRDQQLAICQSRSGYYIATALDKGVGILPKEIHDVVGPYLARLDDKLNSGRQGGWQEDDWPDSSLDGFFPDGLPSIGEGFSETLEAIPMPGRPTSQNLSNPGLPATSAPSSQADSQIYPIQPATHGASAQAQVLPERYSPSSGNASASNSISGNAIPGNSLRPNEQAQQPRYILPR